MAPMFSNSNPNRGMNAPPQAKDVDRALDEEDGGLTGLANLPFTFPMESQFLMTNLEPEIVCGRCKVVYPRKYYGDVDNGRVANLQARGKDNWCWECLGKYIGKLGCSHCTKFLPKDMFSEEEKAKGVERKCVDCCSWGPAPPPVSFLTSGMTRELAEHQQQILTRLPTGPIRGQLPIVFLDIEINRRPIGRIEITLRRDVVPQTAENFRLLVRSCQIAHRLCSKCPMPQEPWLGAAR